MNTKPDPWNDPRLQRPLSGTLAHRFSPYHLTELEELAREVLVI